ncbi:MAG: hypothetical protein ABDH28_06880 [Brevinematia bacterium]
MRQSHRHILLEFVEKNFWGILYSAVAILSLALILLLGVGTFLLIVLVGTVAFLLGNSKDKNISPVENIRNFINKLNERIKNLKS